MLKISLRMANSTSSLIPCLRAVLAEREADKNSGVNLFQLQLYFNGEKNRILLDNYTGLVNGSRYDRNLRA
jgi:hypothetical protein